MLNTSSCRSTEVQEVRYPLSKGGRVWMFICHAYLSVSLFLLVRYTVFLNDNVFVCVHDMYRHMCVLCLKSHVLF